MCRIWRNFRKASLETKGKSLKEFLEKIWKNFQEVFVKCLGYRWIIMKNTSKMLSRIKIKIQKS